MKVSSVSPGAVGDDGAVARALGQLDGLERLGQRADLVDLDEDRVGEPLADALLQDRRVGDEEVVAHELHARAEPPRSAPASPSQSSSPRPSSIEQMG